MDTATGLQPIASHPVITDQRGRNRQKSEDFRRKLDEQAKTEGDPEEAETPMQRTLQNHPATDRRDQGEHHVDVLA